MLLFLYKNRVFNYPIFIKENFMQKTKKIHLLMVTVLLVVLTFVFCYTSFGTNPSPTKQTFLADETSTQSNSDTLAGEFDISIISRSGQNIILSNPVSYENGQAYRTYWSNAQSFSISFSVGYGEGEDSENSNKKLPEANPETGMYELSLTVRYLKGYLSANRFETLETKTFENIPIGEVATTDDYSSYENLDFVLNIDESLGEDVNWGIYLFIVDINGYQATSLYYAIEPTQVVAEEPEIAYYIPSSAIGSLGNLYSFYLVNADSYKYVDERNLKWYVWGQSVDGVRYALLSEDLTDETFVSLSCTQSLYETHDRNGTNFEIEFNNDDGLIYGEWHVWCEYDYSSSPSAIESNTVLLEIEAPFDYINVVYIIAGIAGLALIITIIVSIVKSKKEKVW